MACEGETTDVVGGVQKSRERLAEVLAVDSGQINVKAKTAEKMGPVGEGRAIEARAVCLLAAR